MAYTLQTPYVKGDFGASIEKIDGEYNSYAPPNLQLGVPQKKGPLQVVKPYDATKELANDEHDENIMSSMPTVEPLKTNGKQ